MERVICYAPQNKTDSLFVISRAEKTDKDAMSRGRKNRKNRPPALTLQLFTWLKSRDAFFWSGLLFAAWALLNTSVDIKRYGIEQGFYWWFCNLALMGTAGGLLFKSRGWLTGFLSIACFTQIFWVIDNLHRLFTGTNLFGMVEFMYHPGLPIDEFILSHYHYFTIPVCLYALVRLPRYHSKSLTLILIFNPLIFGVSYFIFPRDQNINCIHSPCLGGVSHWSGPAYSFFFWLAIFLAHIGIGIFLENYFFRLRPSKSFKLLTNKLLIGSLSLCVGISTWDTFYKLTLPSFTCIDGDTVQGVQPRCRFTLDEKEKVMSIVFEVENKSPREQICQVELVVPGYLYPLSHPFALPPGKTELFDADVPYPRTDMTGKLLAVCADDSRRPSSK